MTITFDGISIAGSGMQAYQTWLDAIADNIANINTITATDEVPFQERVVEVQARNPEAGVAGVDVVDTAVAKCHGSGRSHLARRGHVRVTVVESAVVAQYVVLRYLLPRFVALAQGESTSG